jgi:catalase
VLNKLRTAIEQEGALVAIVSPKIGGVTTAKGRKLAADQALSAAPSVFFDAVAALPSEAGAARLVKEAAAIDWLRDAYGHLKVIGYVDAAMPLFVKAAISWDGDEGVVDVAREAPAFIQAAKQHRIWAREPLLRTPG